MNMTGTAMDVFKIKGQSRGRYSAERKRELIASGAYTSKDFRPERYFVVPCPMDKTLPLEVKGGEKVRIYVMGTKMWTTSRTTFEDWKNRKKI